MVKKYNHHANHGTVPNDKANILGRDFEAETIHQKWCTDITYIHVLKEGWTYLACVMDLYSRKIIGYAYGLSMTAELAVEAVKNACLNVKKTQGILVHSDLGSQYTSQAFERYLNSRGMIHSFSRKGNPYDNACIESFHSVLKKEEIHLHTYQDSKEARRAIFEYIEGWYNRKRIHSCAAMLAATAIPANFAMADETKDAENLTEWAMDEPVTLTVLKNQNPATVNYADGEDQYNNVYYNAYRDNLGITLDFQICASGDEYSQKVTLAIASDDLPDLLYLPVAEYSQLAEAGKLAPLDDVLEQYGSELTKKNLNSDGGKILEAAKRNDVLYGIPSGNAERIPSQFLWIRKDWLDKLGLDVPKTLDDVVEVARAFKNDDPDGNGVDDTWGLGVCNEMSDYAGYGTIEGVVNAFGGSILQYMWMPNDDGTVSYEPTSQETRNALEKLAAMYSEGLINEEFGVSDTDAISEAVAAGTCGLFYGTDGISWGAGRDAIANNNDCGWMVINAPSVEGGDATAYSYTNFDYVYAVNANCEHPEALIKLINFNNDRINSPDATLDSLEVWGVNSKTGINQCDYTYALLDPYLNKAIGYNTTIGQVFAGELKPEELMPEAYRYYVGIKRYVDEGYDKTGSANPDDLTAFQYAMCWGPKFGSWTRYSELRDAGMKMSVYTGAPTKTMMKRWSTLLALQDETFVKIISGSLGIEAFDDFVTQWNEQGGSTIQEEIAEMYMK